MKYGKIAAILAGIAILAGGGYAALSIAEHSVNQDTGIEAIFDFDYTSVSSVDITNQTGTYKFEISEDGWTAADENTDIRPYNTAISYIVMYMAELQSTKIIEENASDLSAYGLDNPTVVTCRQVSGTEFTLEIGNNTPTGDNCYVRKAGENTVYTISSDDSKYISVSRDDLKNPYLLNTSDNSITALTLKTNGKTSFSAERTENGWVLNEPYVNVPYENAVFLSEITSICDSLARAAASEYIEENPTDLSVYGLDNPRNSLEISTETETVEYLIGNYSDEKEYQVYVLDVQKNQVLTYYVSNLKCLDYTVSDVLATSYIGYYVPEEVSKVEVLIDGETVSIDIDYKNGVYTFTSPFETVINSSDTENMTLFTDFYNSFAGLTFTDVDTEANPQGDAVYSITYFLLDSDDTLSVSLLKRDDTSYYIMVNGEYTGAVTSESIVKHSDGIVNTWKTLSETLGN